MSTPQAGPVRTPIQIAKERNLVFEHIDSGSYAEVWHSIPKATAERIFSDVDSKTIDQSEAIAQLRESLQAIKITKGNKYDSADDLDNEITVLNHLARSNHPHLVRIHDADTANKPPCWYTLDLLTGNTLGEYSGLLFRTPADKLEAFAPAAFGWHLIHQLTDALLTLHFGDKDGKESRTWPMYAHNDAHLNNMLFRSGPGAYKTYPDIVLVDFGTAQKWNTRVNRTEFFEAQRADMERVMYYVYQSFDWADELFEEIRDLDIQKGVNGNEVLKLWMRSLKDRAFQERNNSYVPLHDDAFQHFQNGSISDADLWKQASNERSAQ